MAKQILLVEDDHDVRRLLTHILEDEGYAVATATTFGEAKPLLKAGGIDLLVSDIVLPGGGSGIELAALAAAHGVKCLLVTGHPDWISNTPETGAPVLLKPFKPGALLREAARMLAPP